MDLVKRSSPGKQLGQCTGKDFQQNAEEAEYIMRMLTPNIMRVAKEKYVLTKSEENLLNDLREKLDTYGWNASVTGRTLFYLRDIKDKLIERGIL